MIYAVKCGKWIKFGKANSVRDRLAELQVGNPYKLKVLAVANWPDDHEGIVHRILAKHRHQGEWFVDCIASREIVNYMKDELEGESLFATLAIIEFAHRTAWMPPEWKTSQPSETQTQTQSLNATSPTKAPRRLQRVMELHDKHLASSS